MVAPMRTFPRTFVPAELDLSDFSKLEPLFEALEDRPIHSVEELDHWIKDIGELGSVLAQEGIPPLHRHDLPHR